MREETIKKVLAEIALDFPGVVDYNVEGETVQLLDVDDFIVATISEEDLTHYWNLAEVEL